MATPTIHDIKEEVLHRARERQASLSRGAYDVPLRYSPAQLTGLLDLLSQLEYRCDFLSLAVPPPHPAISERIKRFFKILVCKSLRWLMIRQVEFNAVALQQARQRMPRPAVRPPEQVAAIPAPKSNEILPPALPEAEAADPFAPPAALLYTPLSIAPLQV